MIRKIGVLVLLLGSGLMLFGQEVISNVNTQEASPLREAGDFLLQDNLLVGYIGENPAVLIPGDLGITAIGDSAFDRKPIRSVVIPEGILQIGNYAFSGCNNLTQVQIPESLSALGEGAFSNCSELEELTIPPGVSSIGENVFSGCGKLRGITVHENNNAYTSMEGVLFTKDQQVLIVYPVGREQTVYIVPNQVRRIEANAFRGAFNLLEITFPESLRTIEDRAFYNCKGLTSLIIPKGLTSIGDRAFSRCVNLAALRIPAGLDRIGASAFEGCTKLDTIEVSKTTQIPDTAFRGVPAKLPYVD